MSLSISLVRADGSIVESIHDIKNQLLAYLPDAKSGTLAGGIDEYGITQFNSLQIKQFIVQWTDITERMTRADDRALAAEVLRMAGRVVPASHLYLRFVGD